MTFVLSIDQGTTNTKAVLFDTQLNVIDRASASLMSSYPANGWAEQSADDIWASVVSVINEIVERNASRKISALAISNQRETLVTWDALTGSPICPAILWQCRRTAQACEELEKDGHGDAIVRATGLGINPLFPASKLSWVIQNHRDASTLAAADRLRAGTVDSWLIWKLTGGQTFATDHSNASRTQLFDTAKLHFSSELCEIFGAPLSALPEPRGSDAHYGDTADGVTALPGGIPIHAVMGDSHAALYGHGIRKAGDVKATFGTGSSLMALAPERVTSNHGLSGTIAWTAAGKTHYAIEGNITVSAQAAEFCTRMLGLKDARELSEMAQTVPDSAGVTFVPALAGLGAPHWDDHARGTISGLSLGSRPPHLARATFEAIVNQVADVFEAMEQDTRQRLNRLHADGGASANDWLMQLQADLLGRPVLRPAIAEIGALGAAMMAFRALGVASQQSQKEAISFNPVLGDAERRSARQQWHGAVAVARMRAN